jgi:hypothetical protein
LRDPTEAAPGVPISRRRIALFFCALWLALAWIGGEYIGRTSFVVEGQRVHTLWDDAMISMQYARNLSEGNGLVWNAGGEPVQGFTNLGVTLAMAAVHGLPLGELRIALAVQLLNLGLLAALLVFVWRAAREIEPDDPAVAAVATVATLLLAPLAIWSLQGADAGFVALWLGICVERVAHAERAGTPWPWHTWALIAAGIGIRPDATIFCLVFLVLSLRAPGPPLRNVARGAFAIALVWAAMLLFGQLYYGDPLPNTYYLKATGAPPFSRLASGASQLAGWLAWMIPAFALAGLAIVRRKGQLPVLLCGALVAVGLAYHATVGGDWMWRYGSRFAAPALPLLVLLVTIGARHAMRTPPVPAWATRPLFPLLAIGIVLLANPSGTLGEWLDPRHGTMLARENYKNFRYASYFRDHTTPDTTLALHWAGVPKYFSHRQAIDVLGRSDRRIARSEAQPGPYRPGHSKWDWDYVVNVRKPDIVIGESRGLRERDDFRDAYVLVKGPRRGFYMRVESLEKLDDDEVAFEDLRTGRRSRSVEGDDPLDPTEALPQDGLHLTPESP